MARKVKLLDYVKQAGSIFSIIYIYSIFLIIHVLCVPLDLFFRFIIKFKFSVCNIIFFF